MTSNTSENDSDFPNLPVRGAKHRCWKFESVELLEEKGEPVEVAFSGNASPVKWTAQVFRDFVEVGRAARRPDGDFGAMLLAFAKDYGPLVELPRDKGVDTIREKVTSWVVASQLLADTEDICTAADRYRVDGGNNFALQTIKSRVDDNGNSPLLFFGRLPIPFAPNWSDRNSVCDQVREAGAAALTWALRDSVTPVIDASRRELRYVTTSLRAALILHAARYRFLKGQKELEICDYRNCHKEFAPRNRNQRYCSTGCAKNESWWRLNHDDKKSIQ